MFPPQPSGRYTLAGSNYQAPGRPTLFAEARQLLDWGFANFQSVPIVKKGEVLGQVAVDKGKLTQVDILAAADLALLLPKGSGQDLTEEINLAERLPAPLSTEQSVGSLLVKSKDGEELGSVALVPAVEVERLISSPF